MAEHVLHTPGRIGADHHQLAMGHVDDAHQAVGDGQAECDEQQDRTQADAGEQHELSIAIGDFAQRENRAALRQGLDDHHAGHYGRSRKVALKERFIDADLFDADDPLQRFQFDDAINK